MNEVWMLFFTMDGRVEVRCCEDGMGGHVGNRGWERGVLEALRSGGRQGPSLHGERRELYFGDCYILHIFVDQMFIPLREFYGVGKIPL